MSKTGGVPPRKSTSQRMFDTRSHSWREAGLIGQIDQDAVKRARVRGAIFLALFVGVKLLNDNRAHLVGSGAAVNTLVRWTAVIALLILGWAMAAAVGNAFAPTLFRRMDPATSGTVGFFTRLVAVVIALIVALRTAGIDTRSLTIGASFAAVIFGLAAQQTLGNVIAGTVLLSARPFSVGERVRLQAGGVGGQVEGVVSSLGLLYTSFSTAGEVTMVPNSIVLNCAVIPLHEPDSVDLRARLRPGVTPGDLQRLLERSLKTPIRDAPAITLEELDGEEVVVRISATPRVAADGPALATEVLAIVSRETRAATGEPAERVSRPGDGPPPDHDGVEQTPAPPSGSPRAPVRAGSQR